MSPKLKERPEYNAENTEILEKSNPVSTYAWVIISNTQSSKKAVILAESPKFTSVYTLAVNRSINSCQVGNRIGIPSVKSTPHHPPDDVVTTLMLFTLNINRKRRYIHSLQKVIYLPYDIHKNLH